MTRDARLDAFASEGADAEESTEELATGDASADEQQDSTDEVPEGDSPPSLATTSEWTPEGKECADCGEVVQRRWRQNDALVCQNCKDWNEV